MPSHPDIKIDFNRAMAEGVGEKEGINIQRLFELETQTQEIHRGIQAMRGMGQIPFLHLPSDDDLLKKVQNAAKKYSEKINDIVVLGIGGSALGTGSLFNAVNGPYANFKSTTAQKKKRLFVCDNIDPEAFTDLINIVHPSKTLFVIVSKSGVTSETLAQYLALKKLKGSVTRGSATQGRRNYFIITDPHHGALRHWANEEKIPSLEVPTGVGGRYSVFSAVGLFPLALAGIDIADLLSGARQMDKRCQTGHVWSNPAAMLAQIFYLALKDKNKSQLVFMPYCDHLHATGNWFVQLWAESLGKQYSLKGEEIFCGQTPIPCRGVTDQHSQLQLFAEGTNDKIFLFVVPEKWRRDLKIGRHKSPLSPPIITPSLNPSPLQGEGQGQGQGRGGIIGGVGGDLEINFLQNRKMGELLHTEWAATERALTEAKRPNLTLFIPEISPHALGQLYQLLMNAAVYAGGLLNVNPFDQPGVERTKQLTRELLKQKELGGFSEMIRKRGGEEKYWV